MEGAFDTEPWQKELYSFLPHVWILQPSHWIDGQNSTSSFSQVIPKFPLPLCPHMALVEVLILSCLDAQDSFLLELLWTLFHGIAREMILSTNLILSDLEWTMRPFLYSLTTSLALYGNVHVLTLSEEHSALSYCCACCLVHLLLTPCLSCLFFKDSSTLLRCEGFLTPCSVLH